MAGRERVAADNTDEVSEHDTTGHKSLVLENGVAGSGVVAEGDAGGLSRRNASGHDNPNYDNSPRSISGRGVSPDDCFALHNDSELALRELTVDGTVRVCVYWALLLLLGLCGVVADFRAEECGIATPHGEHVPRCMRVSFYYLHFTVGFPGIIRIVAVPLFDGRLLHTAMCDVLLPLVLFLFAHTLCRPHCCASHGLHERRIGVTGRMPQ
ncbi:hypothetical protein TCSYLVIO_000934 [Trypanosoma cruzi]|nr:hypothetical protein TCSYLVIO_000934 [Trypanosoma cruzi]